MNTESFVFYETVFKQTEQLHKRKRYDEELELYRAIAQYGLYGVVPADDDDVWLYGFEQAITSISRAKERYQLAIENGKRGGRPAIWLDQEEVLAKKKELKTWKAVAQYYNINEDTLRKIRNSWPNEGEAEKPKNPNDNDNNNDNVNDTVNENKNGKKLLSEFSGKELFAGVDDFIALQNRKTEKPNFMEVRDV